MSSDIRFERLLTDVLTAAAPEREPDRLVPGVIEAASRIRRRPRWLALVNESPMRLPSGIAVGSPTVRLAAFVAMALLLVGLAVGTLVAGASLLPKPASPIPAASLLPKPSPSISADRGVFIATGPPALARYHHTATLLRDGRVLIVGGRDDTGSQIASAELWDPATGRFSPTGSLAQARAEHTATLLGDGRVLIVGGQTGPGEIPLASAEIWDPATGSFSPTGSMTSARSGHTATLLQRGRVLVVGGDHGVGGGHASVGAEVWDPATGSFSPTGSPVEPRTGHTATLLADGRVLVVGGVGSISTGSSAATEALALAHPQAVTPLTLGVGPGEGAPLIGRNAAVRNAASLATAEVWDPATGAFSPAGSLAVGRDRHTATLLPDGRVLITGGMDGVNPVLLASSELWDPATATFSATGSMAAGRADHTATLLPDGRVLMVGGTINSQIPDGVGPRFAELYDPTTGAFTPTGSSANQGSPSVLLPDGRVLFVGGLSNGALGQAELFELK